MKKIIAAFSLILLISSCKSDTKENTLKANKPKPLNTVEKIAKAYGFEYWKNVSQIKFAFNVERNGNHLKRHWTWEPKTGNVALISNNDTITYNRKSVDSLSLKADKSFINDKYWLLAPYQLLWDQGTTISNVTKEKAPISKILMNKITLTYPNNGGYTPGDAYDFYFGDDYLIKEWIYRKESQKEPSLITTWENHEDFNGLKLALKHVNSEDGFKLYFSNVTVTLN